MTTKVVRKGVKNYNIYIGRPSHWGNPWSHKDGTLAKMKVNTPEEAVENYKKWLWGIDFTDYAQDQRWWILDHLGDLRNQILGCYCKPNVCHGDVLADIVNNWDEGVK